ncbi:MAG TPA: ComEC/Rec2 family competence protein, partial [Patescibacteria group bacterium]
KINLPLSSFFLVTILAVLVFIRIVTYLPLSLEDGQVKLIGKITTEPRIFGTTQYFRIENLSVKTGTEVNLEKGDRVKLSGISLDNQIAFPKIEIVDKNKSQISKFRNYLAGKVKKQLPSPYSDLILGMVLGIDSLPGVAKENLRNAGTIHAVVVSGQNITLLAGLVLGLVGFLNRRLVLVLVIGLVFFYSFLTGFAPPAVRASLMASIAFSGQIFGRQTYTILVLVITGLVMLIFSPQLLGDLSFQLSFAATFGIIAVAPLILGRFKFLPKLLAEGISISLAAYLMTLPILGFSFNQVSLVGVLANIFVYPMLGLCLILSLLATLFAPIPILGMVFAYLALFPLWIFYQISAFFASLPLATLGVNLSSALVWIYYIVLGILLLTLQGVKLRLKTSAK